MEMAIKDDKMQALREKIKQRIRAKQEKKVNYDQQSNSSLGPEEQYEQIPQGSYFDAHQQAQCNYQRSSSELRDYVDIYNKGGGDSQYIHKLIFDFFKAQAIFQNMQKDENNHLIYQKFLKSEIKKPNSLNFVEIKPSIEPNPSKTDASNQNDKKMTMKDKLQTGKFIPYGHIPQNDQIQQYRSIPSEDQILEQDCLEQLIRKTKKGKQFEKPRYARKKHKSNHHEDFFKGKHRSRSVQSQSSKRINYPDSQKKGYHNSFESTEFQDSSNEAHYDSQQSQFEKNSESSEDDYSDEQQSNQQIQYDGVAQDFKHLDMYEQMDDFAQDQDIEYLLNSALNSGKEKKIHGVQQYHFMKKAEKDKYFKKLTKQFQNDLKRLKQQKKQQKQKNKPVRRSQVRSVNFCDSIYFKVFNNQAKPTDVKIADEKQEVLVKAIWQYDEQ